MPSFEINEEVNVMVNGVERLATIIGLSGDYAHLFIDGGQSCQRRIATLLRLRGPYFDLRGQVLTRSANHPNEPIAVTLAQSVPTHTAW